MPPLQRRPVPKQLPVDPQPAQSVDSPSSVWVIDQIEEQIASVEVDGRTAINVPLWMLPRGVQEGDVLRVTMAHDPAEQARRLERSKEQVSVKSKNDPGGDVVL